MRGVIRRGDFGGREEGRWLSFTGYPEGLILDEVQLVGSNVWTAGRFAFRSIEHNDSELAWDLDRRFGPRDGAFAVAFDAVTGASVGEVLGVVDVQVNSDFVAFARTGTTTAAVFLRWALPGFEPSRTQIQTLDDDGTRAAFQVDGFIPLAADASDGRINVYGFAWAELSVGEERFDCTSCNTDLAIISMALDGSDVRLERIVTAAVERPGTRVGATGDGTAHMVVSYDADESAVDRLFESRVAIVSLSGR